ncbi:Flavin-containing monooxygenase FMO GS-OX-like 3, partial [Glycine soja]
KFNCNGLTLFEKEVVKVEKKGTEWVVEWKRKSQKGDSLSREGFDAAIVCSGHSAEPKLAEVLGIDTWHGVHMLSYNYRVPQPFNNQVVILIGLFDISRDIAHVAKEVHTATRLNPDLAGMKFGDYGNIMFHTTVCI